jgi:CNT family concentrative nucleoside transporter
MVSQGFIGIIGLLALGVLLSENRRQIPWRTVGAGLALQWELALLFLHVPGATKFFLLLNHAVEAVQYATDQGTSLVFGFLGGAPLPYAESHPGASFILAFRALPIILTVSAIASVLFYWGVLQRMVQGFAWVLRRSMGIGGALGLAASVHVFVGMIEAPLLVRPYLARMGRGELFALMSCGMAGIAGSVMVIYASMLGPVIPNALGNILIASLISTPAAIAMAAMMVPFRPSEQEIRLVGDESCVGTMDAIVKGTADGVTLLVNVIAMLIVLVALVALSDRILSLLPFFHGHAITFERLAGMIFTPVMWAIGMPWDDALVAGQLMGSKTILNEFVAYLDLAALPVDALSPRSRLMVTYALCGFANCSSIGILIGGIGAMIPERKREVVELAAKSLISGTMATCLSGAVVGII